MSDYDELRRLLAAAPVGSVYAFEAEKLAAREALRDAAVKALPGLLDEIERLQVYERCHDRQTFDPACPRCGSP